VHNQFAHEVILFIIGKKKLSAKAPKLGKVERLPVFCKEIKKERKKYCISAGAK
jgi:hypothetical protein